MPFIVAVLTHLRFSAFLALSFLVSLQVAISRAIPRWHPNLLLAMVEALRFDRTKLLLKQPTVSVLDCSIGNRSPRAQPKDLLVVRFGLV
jgi:hypothetical protein